MRRLFPGFSYQRRAGAWTGYLQPADWARGYRIRIVHPAPERRPSVWVDAPTLHPNAPHRFPDDSLCLYDPKDPLDQRWHSQVPLALTIVPWTAEWLFFYELWLESGTWHGPEAAHGSGPKRPA
jgi:hypothetical protein